MALSVWISLASQYGVLATGESRARQGTLRQAVAQTIKRHLFEDDDTYARVLRDFAGRLRADFTIGKDWQTAQRLWQGLLPEEETAPATLAEPPGSPVSGRIEAVFGLALHGLCATLAGQWVDQPNRDPDETEDDEDDETNAPPGAPLAGEYAQAVDALVGQLRQITWKWRRDLPEDERPEAEHWRVVARVLLDTLLAVLDNWFAVQTVGTRHRDGKPHTLKQILIHQSALAQRIERLLQTLPLRFAPQPLRAPVAYRFDDHDPADDTAETCIRIDLIGYRQTNTFLRRIHRDILDDAHRPPAFEHYIAAINLQQAVPWRINGALLSWTRALIAVVDPVAASGIHAPHVDALTPETRAELLSWVTAHLYRPKSERPRNAFSPRQDGDRRKARPGEFLDSPLASRALAELCPDNSHTDPPAFYLPWKADYRGRIYAETPWFTPQGGDLQRALMEFARGQILDAAGVIALRRHGANLVARSRVLTDLGIRNRQVVTLEERERWVREHEDAILASAANPLTEPFWRTVADKPMQFLAFCLAYRQWQRHPEAPVHLPVQIDGTCNGLQHIAALTGDAELAKAVNVLPRADGLPADIYSDLADAARKTLGQTVVSKGQGVHRQGLELANAWLTADPARGSWLDRKTAKKVVMTIPYGASHGAQAQGVLEAIEEKIRTDWQRDPPPLSELDALVDAIHQDKTRQRRGFIARCTCDRFDEARRSAFAGDDEPAKTRARAEWERLRTFAAYVALALVEHLHGALDRDHPEVRRFADWLGQTTKACAGTDKAAGLPMLWLTPLGFPVVQDKFASKGTSVTVQLGGQSIKLDVQRLTEDVEPAEQHDALLPNLIHSLDATHLMLTLLEADARGVHDIGSIHDCLLCHPNQAETLARVVRTTFADLYARDEETGLSKPLSTWHSWMKQVVELRTLPHRGLVIGAMKQPGGLGERSLEHDADEGRPEAVAARAWLAQIRERTPPPERFLLRLLLERAATLPTPSPQPRLTKPPIAGDGPALSEDAMSPYFFS